MGQVVYADLLFLIDFSMDFLCLYITARLLHRRFYAFRGVLAATFGAIYSVVVIFFSMNVWLLLLSDLGICAMICLIAYGCKDKSLYEFCLCGSAYFGVSVCLGGFMTAIYSLLNRFDLPLGEYNASDGISVWLFGLLALMSALAAMLGGRFFRNATSCETADVEISYLGKSVTVRAFVDTGNIISDPLSGRTVIVLDRSAAVKIMSAEAVDVAIKGRVGLMGADEMQKIRFVPVKTANGGSMLCAFVPERVRITVADGNKRVRSFEVSALFAPTDLYLSGNKIAGGCRALISPELLA